MRMKKCLFLSFACWLAIFGAQAQFRFGVKAGISSNFVSADVLKYAVNDNALGWYVGPTGEYLFTDRLGMNGGVFYAQKSIEPVNADSHTIGYIEVPVNFNYFFPLSNGFTIYAGAGPYVRFKVSGGDSFTMAVDDIVGEWDARSVGTGMNFTGGVELFRFLQVGITFGLGMSDSFVDNGGRFSTQERIWMFAVAAYF